MAKSKNENQLVSQITVALKERRQLKDAVEAIAYGMQEGTPQEFAKSVLKELKKKK